MPQLTTNHLRSAALSLAGTARCVSCGRPGPRLCRRCADAIPPPAGPIAISGTVACVAAASYAGAAKSLVLHLKRRRDRDAALPLARLLRGVIVEARLRPEVVTWVPGRTTEIRTRGFDHAALIGGHVSSLLGVRGIPLLSRASVRPHQAGSTREERRRNVRGTFMASHHAGRVLLVDDVLTTGATAAACVAALRAAGVAHVDVAVVCRA